MSERRIVTVLETEDEYTHEPDEASNYNESMYFNAFDLGREVGGWFRLGNRVNEGHAEASVCTYLPGGRVGFTYQRPPVETNDEMNAGGLEITVVEPFEHLRVTYSGFLCLLDEPRQMAEPRKAFEENPWVDAEVDLDIRRVAPVHGGRPVYEDGSEIEMEAERSFAKAHYEQHCATTGSIRVDDEVLTVDGLGLRDHSWGPRYWQAIDWYRWLPMAFTEDFAMTISDVGGRQGGMVLEGDEYHPIRSCTIDTDWDDDRYQTAMRCTVDTDHDRYEVEGEVISLIPLRNRRTTPDGDQLLTRITEAMTRYRCRGETGIGMSEYLDQIVDGVPLGAVDAGADTGRGGSG
ncbi:MAG: hypothetical protein U5R31_17800 [Acidimicrobiia bacterium]|nr:hypothetical protein [Acidimicrobiia bacterium]